MEPFEYLRDCIITDIAPSKVHGIGTIALRNIERGEELFKLWEGDTGVYTILPSQFDNLPKYVQIMILKSFENHRDTYDFIWFRLIKDTYFTLANPMVFTNTKEINGNFSSQTKTVLNEIKEGDELFGTYNLKNTIL